MVHSIYVEKKDFVANDSKNLLTDIQEFVGITNLQNVRILNRYYVENIDENLFDSVVNTVFSEPQLDTVYYDLNDAVANDENCTIFAVEYLPGQFDQRADSAAQCIQIISQQDRPLVRTGKVYVLYGNLSDEDINTIKQHIINPVESQETSLDVPTTLKIAYDVPENVEIIDGFMNLTEDELANFISERGLAMDLGDIKMCQDYFANEEHRNPTITEINMIDTYWSDHCRHTTFNTTLDNITFEDKALQEVFEKYIAVRQELNRTKPITLMDLGTIATKYLKFQGKLPNLDESEEVNACTVKIKVNIDGEDKDWLLLFKNETHNHPTEIEPFGGAATCVGGAIRDPLSGRAYVYGAMRVTGAADPLAPIDETLEGKLPQRKIVTTAANGYSSYGNQIGVATGQVDEIYHPGYIAKRMEIGAVIAATPAENVRRERPNAGDKVILLGGKTGRDGCGGATGSSKSHDISSLSKCGAEVQKGNAPEERKLQRLFRNAEASKLIKRCNDFGAGGVSVAIGELADGLDIQLDTVPKKYDGLDGTELAISESQERMAVVVEAQDVDKFCQLASDENLESTVVATVTEAPRLVMHWRGQTIVDVSRAFLDTNGAEKHIDVVVANGELKDKDIPSKFTDGYKTLAGDLNVCSKRGLSERFDSTIGANTVLMPFGGKYQKTPSQSLAFKISTEKENTTTCSLMSYGYNPYISEASPYHGAYLAVVESVCKLIASGTKFEDVYLTFQEYFEKLGVDSKKWGKPTAALLGAFEAQIGFGIASIGGKDSMSGTFENINVPPTLVSFAVTCDDVDNVISNEFKSANNQVVWLKPQLRNDNLPDINSLLAIFKTIDELAKQGVIKSIYTPTYGGVAEAIMKMSFGNNVGFDISEEISLNDLFGYAYGSFVIELAQATDLTNFDDFNVQVLGTTNGASTITYQDTTLALSELLDIYENKLEPIYECNIQNNSTKIETISYQMNEARKSPRVKTATPKVLIPAFPGTNCEYDSAKAMMNAGADAEIILIKNQTSDDISYSIENFANKAKEAQMIFLPGGFSGGDEPDGSGKFITAFFRNKQNKEAVHNLLNKNDGLMLGICNGFQALIKLGLVPFGEIIDTDENCPTLTFNDIGRHQSKIIQTRIASNKSPWLANTQVGDIYSMPISHGEGKFVAPDDVIQKLITNGQIATQYVDLSGNPTMDIQFNPNGSMYAIEGITSPDGRVFGKMGHCERTGYGLYKNVIGKYDFDIFKNAVAYFK